MPFNGETTGRRKKALAWRVAWVPKCLSNEVHLVAGY